MPRPFQRLLAEPVFSRWVGPMVLVVVGFFLFAWSLGTWPDVLVDFGDELYVPWQLAEGRVLYRDIMHLKGPLSQYLNALWFRLFGTSLLTIVVANMVVLVALTWLLSTLLSKLSKPLPTVIACVVFLTLFAFGQLVGLGNGNFVCPYTHEVTHGLVLTLAAIGCLAAYHRRPRLRLLVGAGLSLGLAFLTDGPVFLAGASAVLVGLLLTMWTQRTAPSRAIGLLGTIVGSATAPPLFALALLSLAMPMAQALQGVSGTWWYIARGDVFSQPYYQWFMGTDDLRGNLRALLAWSGGYAAIFFPAGILSLGLQKSGWCRKRIGWVVFAMVAGWLTYWSPAIRWTNAFRPLPGVMFGLWLVSFAQILKTRRDAVVRERLILRLTLLTFATLLLGKMILNARIWHNGFVLAMPATLLFVVALIDWVPAWIAQRGGSGGLFQAMSLAMLLVTVVVHLKISSAYFSRKIYPVGAEDDAFLADARGIFVNAALKEIAQRLGPKETLAVLPAGVMVNYLSRRVNPTRYPRVDPLNVGLWTEEQILASFLTTQPDYILLVHKDTSDHGFRFFGRDYGKRLYSWVQEQYRQVKLIGALPLQDERFGVLLLRRADEVDRTGSAGRSAADKDLTS